MCRKINTLTLQHAYANKTIYTCRYRYCLNTDTLFIIMIATKQKKKMHLKILIDVYIRFLYKHFLRCICEMIQLFTYFYRLPSGITISCKKLMFHTRQINGRIKVLIFMRTQNYYILWSWCYNKKFSSIS